MQNKKYYFMKTKNILLPTFFLIIGMLFVACTSDEDVNQKACNNNKSMLNMPCLLIHWIYLS